MVVYAAAGAAGSSCQLYECLVGTQAEAYKAVPLRSFPKSYIQPVFLGIITCFSYKSSLLIRRTLQDILRLYYQVKLYYSQVL